MGVGTQKIGSPSDVTNVNPMTGNIYNMLQNQMAMSGAQMGGTTALGNIAALQGIAPGIQGLTGLLTGPYVQNAEQTRDLIQQEAMQGVAGMFANQGNLQSGAALSAMARGAAQPAAQAATQIAGLQSQMGSGLAQQFLGQRGQEYSTQAALTGQGLGLLGQYGMPEYWQPTYTQGMSPSVGLLQGAGAGAGIGSAFGPAGAGIGAGIGGGIGLLGSLLGF